MQLEQYQDNKYREFQQKLIVSSYPLLGIRIPLLRKIAKSIDYDEFINGFNPVYYEDVILYGIVLVKEKDEKKRIKLIEDYIKYIDCWSICDTFCANLSFIKKDLDKYLDWVLEFLNDERTFYVRFGLVMLLKYYCDCKYFERVLEAILKIASDSYYCQMAIAWLLCEFATKDKNLIDFFVKKLSDPINKMYERKIKDSFRIK